MINTVSVEKFLKTLVHFSRFDNGEAVKILEEVKESSDGLKIVFENDEPSCVIMTWSKYKKMLEETEDQYLLGIVDEREKNGSGKTYSEQEVMRELGITEKDIEEAEDLEIE